MNAVSETQLSQMPKTRMESTLSPSSQEEIAKIEEYQKRTQAGISILLIHLIVQFSIQNGRGLQSEARKIEIKKTKSQN